MKALFSAFRTEIQSQHERWILWSPVLMGAGIGFYFSLHSEPPLYVGLAALCGMAALLAATYKNKPLFLAVLALFLLTGGFATAQLRTWAVTAPVLSKKTRVVTVEGRVMQVETLPKSCRVTLENPVLTEGALRDGQQMPERVRVKLKPNEPCAPQAGDTVSVRAMLMPLSPPVLPGAFDFQRHAFFSGLGATGYALGSAVIERKSGAYFFDRLQHDIVNGIRAEVPDPDRAAIIAALLVGESRGISEKSWDIIRKAGIAHLIAISGFNITLVVGLVFFLFRAALASVPYAALHWPVKKISAVVGLAAAIFYLLLIGSPVPALRSVIMVCIAMFAIMIDRDPFTLRLTAFSALLVLLLEPESLVGPSFQMSYAAVVALIAFYEGTREGWSRLSLGAGFFRKLGLYFFGCLVTTVIASSATTLFSLYHFSRVTFLPGLVSNMVAVPVSAFITMPFGLLACFLMPLHMGLEHWPLQVAGKSVDVIMGTAQITAGWQAAVFHTHVWPVHILVIAALGGLWLALWRGRLRLLGVPVVLAALCLIPFTPRPDMLLSDDGTLMAVRDASGVLWLSPGRAEKFVRDSWSQMEGQEDERTWAKDQSSDFLSCDSQACLYRAKGFTVSLVGDASALTEDCAAADMVVAAGSTAHAGICPGKIFLNKWSLHDYGAHAVYLHEGGKIEIRTVVDARGIRPWTGSQGPWTGGKKDKPSPE